MRLNKKGVSLPELLAVIVIMGLIALIAIPAFTSTIENTRKNAVVSEVQTLVDKVQTEVTANNITDGNNIDWVAIEADYNGNLPFDQVAFDVTITSGQVTIDLTTLSGFDGFDWDDANCGVNGSVNKTNLENVTKDCVA